ncbi:hypothetical protein [Pseudomonas jinjuensis]|uniref:hypothetical protein n=1 Tax=Pseudomonas jinjuensis TaxID=198616 RepID=UPI0011144C69|nr:hypothetical protein [Pseudomonas jinjuensis]
MIVANHHSNHLTTLKCLIFKNFVGVVDWSGAHYRDLEIPVNDFFENSQTRDTPARPNKRSFSPTGAPWQDAAAIGYAAAHAPLYLCVPVMI